MQPHREAAPDPGNPFLEDAHFPRPQRRQRGAVMEGGVEGLGEIRFKVT